MDAKRKIVELCTKLSSPGDLRDHRWVMQQPSPYLHRMPANVFMDRACQGTRIYCILQMVSEIVRIVAHREASARDEAENST